MIIDSFPISKDSVVWKLQQKVMKELQEDSNKKCDIKKMTPEDFKKYGEPSPRTEHLPLEYRQVKRKVKPCKKQK